ncbi:hypothetical protein [Paenibacillus sp. DYY-L-2]
MSLENQTQTGVRWQCSEICRNYNEVKQKNDYDFWRTESKKKLSSEDKS